MTLSKRWKEATVMQEQCRWIIYKFQSGFPNTVRRVAHAHPQNADTTAYRADTTVHGAVRETVQNTEHSPITRLAGKR